MANKKMEKTVSDQLEQLGWRVTRREQDVGYEQMATPGKWAAIISVVMQFQNRYNGSSPSNPVISRETGMSPGQVQYHLAQMEKRGLIIDRNGWPRRIVVTPSAKVAAQQGTLTDMENEPQPKPEEATVIDSSKVTKAKAPKKKRESFLVVSRKFAEVLIDHYDRNGKAPLIKEIGEALGYSHKPVGLSRVVKEMVQRGWLHHKPGFQRDFVLTGLGRATLFGELREDLHTDMMVHRQPNLLATAPTSSNRTPTSYRDTTMEEQQKEPGSEQPDKIYQPPPPAPLRQEPAPQPSPTRTGPPSLVAVDSVDLVLELIARGFRVSR